MSENKETKKYRINIPAQGGIEVEAPTKEECIELFNEATKVKKTHRIDESVV